MIVIIFPPPLTPLAPSLHPPRGTVPRLHHNCYSSSADEGPTLRIRWAWGWGFTGSDARIWETGLWFRRG